MTTPYSALRQLIAHLDDSPSASPAGVHGLWVGRLSAGGVEDSDECWSYTLRFLGGSGAVDSRLSQAFMGLMRFTLGSLEQSDFTFAPWLPDEETPCRARLVALAEWCRGFLEGLVSVTGNDLAALSDDTRELLEDLMDIGDVDVDIDESEQDEREFEELAEFVKVAALNIYLDIRSGGAPARKSRNQTADLAGLDAGDRADGADLADDGRFVVDAHAVDAADDTGLADDIDFAEAAEEFGAENTESGDPAAARRRRAAVVKPTLH